MRGDRHVFSLPPLYFVLSPYPHPIDCTSYRPQSSPVFKIKDIATIHTGSTKGSLAGKMSTICQHCRVVMLIISLCYLQRALVLWLAGLLIFLFVINVLPHTLPQILSIIKAKAHNEKVKKSEFIAAFYLYIMQ